MLLSNPLFRGHHAVNSAQWTLCIMVHSASEKLSIISPLLTKFDRPWQNFSMTKVWKEVPYFWRYIYFV